MVLYPRFRRCCVSFVNALFSLGGGVELRAITHGDDFKLGGGEKRRKAEDWGPAVYASTKTFIWSGSEMFIVAMAALLCGKIGTDGKDRQSDKVFNLWRNMMDIFL